MTVILCNLPADLGTGISAWQGFVCVCCVCLCVGKREREKLRLILSEPHMVRAHGADASAIMSGLAYDHG